MTLAVNAASDTGVVSSNTATLNITINAGHTVVIAAMSNAGGSIGSTGTFTDSQSNTYSIATTHNDGGTRIWAIAYCIGIANQITSVTWTPAGTSTGIVLAVWDIYDTAAATISFASGNSNLLTAVPTTANAITTSSLSITSSTGILLGYAQSAYSYHVTSGTSPISFTQDGQVASVYAIYEHALISSAAAATWSTPTGPDIDFVMAAAFQTTGAGATIAWIT